MAPTSISRFRPLHAGFFRRFAGLLLASTLVLLLASSALAAIDATRPSLAQTASPSERSWIPGDTPDVAVLIAGFDRVDPVIDAVVVPTVLDIPGVRSLVTESLPNGRVSVLVSLEDGAPVETAAAIATAIEQVLPEAQVSVGGRTVVDRDILDRMNRGMIIAVVPVLVLLALLVSASMGIRLGVAAAGAVGLSAVLGGAMGARAAGQFDGTLATTAIPAVLVAVLVSSVLTFRLIDWFKHPQGQDQAAMIRNSIAHLLPEAAMLFSGLVVTAVVMELFSAGRTSATVVAVGGLIAAIVTLGALPAMLATMGSVPSDEQYRLFRLPTPDGRDLPTAVLAGFALFLLGLGLFAMRAPSNAMVDADALPMGEASRRVSEQLIQSGGDPSDAIVATIDESTSPAQLDLWATEVSELSTVGWVETATGRYEGGSLVEASAVPSQFATSDAFFAIVSPTVGGRSTAAQALVDQIEEAPGLPAAPALAGVPVDAAAVAASGSSGLWVLVILLALTGGLTVYLLLDDLFLAGITVGLRLLGTAASLGIFFILFGSASGAELQVLALVVNIGVGLFEIGFLRRIGIGRAMAGSPVVLVGDALRREGRAAMFGLGVTALVGLGFLASDLEVARRLGVAVGAGIVIELLIGNWLLRPAVLGQRAVGISLRKPAPAKTGRIEMLMAKAAKDQESLDSNPEWRRIVGGLLRSEFDCQAFPETAALETIFVEETPLIEEVASHNRRLLDTGLRVAGRPPSLKAISVVNTSSPVTLSVTVEHPLRYLVDANGRQIGQRATQLREGMLWLVQDPSGRYRITEAVDLGEVETLDLRVVPEAPIDLIDRVPVGV